MSPPSDRDENGAPRPPGPPPSAREMAEGGPRQEDKPAPARPTPVRKALEREGSPPLPEVPPPERGFADAGDQEWRVRLEGRTRSGTGADAGAPLVLLTFQRVAGPQDAEEPDAGGSMEILAVAETLDELSDDELRVLLARARARGFEPGDFFEGTRRGRRGEGG